MSKCPLPFVIDNFFCIIKVKQILLVLASSCLVLKRRIFQIVVEEVGNHIKKAILTAIVLNYLIELIFSQIQPLYNGSLDGFIYLVSALDIVKLDLNNTTSEKFAITYVVEGLPYNSGLARAVQPKHKDESVTRGYAFSNFPHFLVSEFEVW